MAKGSKPKTAVSKPSFRFVHGSIPHSMRAATPGVKPVKPGPASNRDYAKSEIGTADQPDNPEGAGFGGF